MMQIYGECILFCLQSWLQRVMALYPPHTASSPELPQLIQDKLNGNVCNITVALAAAKVRFIRSLTFF